MKRLPARLLQLLTAALAIASLLATASACGDDDAPKSPTPAPTQSTQAATAAPSPTATAPPSPTPTTPSTTVTAAPCPANAAVSGTAQPSGGAVAITLKFSVSANGVPCLYAGPVMVRLLDSGGVPLLGMSENPVTFLVGSTTLLLSWRNWCAAPGTFRASVSAGDATTLVGIQGPPSCTVPKEKSMLSLAMP